MGRCQNSTFSEYGHVAYQIKRNDSCSNIAANISSEKKVKDVEIQLFQNMVMLYIKLKGMTNAAIRKHIFCPYTHPRPLGRGR